jgi:signal peptidase II
MPVATLLLSAVLLVALDQATKSLVLSRLRVGHATSLGRVAIRRVINRGGRAGFFTGNKALLILWIIEVSLLLALVQFWLFRSAVAQVALGVALGGASGNLFDRLWRGGVVDFIDVGIWPVFNLADTAIVAGALLAALSIR